LTISGLQADLKRFYEKKHEGEKGGVEPDHQILTWPIKIKGWRIVHVLHHSFIIRESPPRLGGGGNSGRKRGERGPLKALQPENVRAQKLAASRYVAVADDPMGARTSERGGKTWVNARKREESQAQSA